MSYVTRFAPSPTGPLHLGHAFSALLAFDRAQAKNGDFLLRIEDIDTTRCRPHWENQIYDDLTWLGLSWPTPTMRQSDRFPIYTEALQKLEALGVVYPCFCTRADIKAALSAPQEGVPTSGPDGLIYPGTCRERASPIETDSHPALRMDMKKALNLIAPKQLSFKETSKRHNGCITLDETDLLTNVGDIVLSRRDLGTSYHLSVVLDDFAQGVTEVVRGEDLFEATKIHVVLQALLKLPTPLYHHHELIRDTEGRRLAKRDDARAISLYRAQGDSPADIRKRVGL